jgi:topoisomerase IV subunit A
MSARKKNEKEEIVEAIEPSTLDELMGERFDIYAKEVIQDRAIPDARDGLKPVQRRIIFAMYNVHNTIDKPTKKCAHIVGDVMGKYHPHGDSSIYGALVHMSQKWSMRLPLIDFQGNNGSIDGDGAAAFRYTEARLAAISNEMVRDIAKDTVDMELTFDDTEFEPTVLPSRFPNLLVNGSTGIAVGIATEIPPHNLKEICQAVIHRIKHPHCPVESLMAYVPGPDFPTGGVVYESQGLKDIYLKGRGRIDVVSCYHIEEKSDSTSQIIITEIPYGVVKSALVRSIDEIRHDKKIDGIEEVRDESDKDGIRIVVDIKKGFKADAVLAYLMGKTQLKTGYSANMVAIVDGRPQTLDLASYCDTYIAHQLDVITRRSEFDLKKNEDRLEIVLGLIKAYSIINEVVATIRASQDKADSMNNLMAKFSFTSPQAKAIVEMPLYKLSHTDIAILEGERDELEKQIAILKGILSSADKKSDIIIEDLRAIAKAYGDERRTQITKGNETLTSVDKRDLIAKEEVILTVSRDGYVKRSSLASWRSSGGLNGAMPGLKAGDALIYEGNCNTTDFLLAFTNLGNYLYVPIHLLKANKWLDEGVHVNYAISLSEGEKLIRAFAVRSFRDDLYIAIMSRKGQIKRAKLSDFPVTRYNRPIRIMRLLSDDEVQDVALTCGNSSLALISETGQVARYNENQVPLNVGVSSGVKAASFKGTRTSALLSFGPDEPNAKFFLVTDLGNVRVISISNVEEGDRLSKAGTLYKCFKSEPHIVVMADRVDEKPSPYHLFFNLADQSTFDCELPSWNLTPMDKYAKREDSFPKKAKVASVNRRAKDYIDESIVSYELPVKEAAAEAEPQESEEIDRPAERFEQISIFGDDD